MNIDIPVTHEVAGFFTIELFKADKDGKEIPGTRRQPVPTFQNLITNGGMNRYGEFTDYLNNCQVGSGSTPPNVNDSTLVSRIAGVVFLAGSITSTVQSTAPYYAANTRTYQFAAGIATGNLSEVGVGWLTTAGLFSRALIVDGAGTPTTITVLADEILQVTYQLRYYAPVADASGTVTLGGVAINWISRACNVTNSSNWAVGVSAALAPVSNQVAYAGAIGAVTGQPAGSVYAATTIADAAYSAGTFTRAGDISWGLAAGNFSGGITAIKTKHGAGAYQYGFTPAIMKDSTQTLSLTFSHSWARKTL